MKKILAILMFFFSANAFAGFEVRANYGTNSYDPTLMNRTWSPSSLHLEEGTAMGADIVYVFDGVVPIGIRYEMIEENITGFGNTRDLEQTRMSAVVGWRFFKSKRWYMGLIGTMPFSSEAEYDQTGGSNFNAESESASGFTGGLDAAYFFGNFIVGVEAGTADITLDEFKNSAGATVNYNGAKMEIDQSGMYYKAHLGWML